MIESLPYIPLFQDLDPAQIALLKPLCEKFSCPADTEIFEQGAPAVYLYLLIKGEVEIRYRKDDDTRLILEIVDNGIPFDPLSLSEPDLTANVSDRKIGGLGVIFIREMTDEVRYRRDGDANVLTLTFSK